MLVLSRRTDESIVFPTLGVTVKVLRLDGSKAKLGVQAPADVRILREEISQAPAADLPRLDGTRTGSDESGHRLRNRLNTVSLSLMLYRQQMAAGQLDAANHTFLQLIEDLEHIESNLSGESTPKSESPFDILLVEDDDRQRDLMSKYLINRGCNVRTAANMNQATTCLDSSPSPDFVLLDLNLPGSDGAETLRRMRPYRQGSQIFALTGSDRESLGIRKSDRDYVDHWFAKPTNPEQVLRRMHQGNLA